MIHFCWIKQVQVYDICIVLLVLQVKNPVILLNKGSVIQSAGGQQLAEEVPVQLVGAVSVLGGDSAVGSTASPGQLAEDEGTRKRREVLARRPSYRKILNELSMPQHQDSAGLATLQVSALDGLSVLHDEARTQILALLHY